MHRMHKQDKGKQALVEDVAATEMDTVIVSGEMWMKMAAEQVKQLMVAVGEMKKASMAARVATETVAVFTGRESCRALLNMVLEADGRVAKAANVAEKLLVMLAMNMVLMNRETSINMASKAAYEVMDAAIVVEWTAKALVAVVSVAKSMLDVEAASLATTAATAASCAVKVAQKAAAELNGLANGDEVSRPYLEKGFLDPSSSSSGVPNEPNEQVNTIAYSNEEENRDVMDDVDGEDVTELSESIEVDNHFHSIILAISLNPGNTFASHNEKEDVDPFPLGYIFKPTDQELIHYLQKKINNEKLPPNRIKVVRLYDFATPEDLITGDHPLDDKCYFLTKIIHKAQKSSRSTDGGSWTPTIADGPIRKTGNVSRITPGGSWTAITANSPIHNNGRVIGYKRSLRFHKGPGKKADKVKTKWIMYEYSVENSGDTTCDGLKPNDWVLCSIHKRPESKDTRLRDSNDEPLYEPLCEPLWA